VKCLQKAALGDVTTFVRGLTFKPTDVMAFGSLGSIACMRTKNVQTELDTSDVWAIPEQFVTHSEKKLECGDILVSTANSLNLVGRCSWVPKLAWPATFGGFVTVLRANPDRINPRYLYWWLSSDRTQVELRARASQTTNIANLTVERCRQLQLYLPPLPEQRRVADILDRAEGLRAKRRAAIDNLDTLTQSIFLDMFGDPVFNPHGWPLHRISDYVADFEGGKSFQPEDAGASTRRRVLKISAVTSGRFRPEERKPVADDYQPEQSHFVREGDLLISRANTVDLVGAVALVDSCPPDLLLPDKLWRFVWRIPILVEPLFVRALFQSPSMRSAISQNASGTGGSMKNISKAKLMQLLSIVPPLELQRRFADMVTVVMRSAVMYRASLVELDALFLSLQHRAFRGEL
jgi:type I restriction enzyme, S subunit